ncbi:MAG: ATP-binding cassette domain-containing protein [Planctomycetes bacterium]|nr:ATP-binding cassette domain-containing protein [Planctomycetota bacterium]MCB9909528.1 ATP-binding cassette domain-containing protein [Planctomycetota bacterium]MCB9912505.1 ATP-binding cassette domain-containing protein [Planctomycetota bacterium]HPF15022.1 ATP-binding cassette domain-containing protein [Planctomycetota bacterium]HRV81964.1 ATP-binding cassette domain-containing protein [Planctomycetota bacterium]
MQPAPLLLLEGVRHGYGPEGPAWAWPHLELAAGQSIACTGPSGSGKTTLLELLAGLQTPQAGLVACMGTPWSTLANRERQRKRLEHLGLVFQGFELLAALDVRENVRLPLRLLGYAPSDFDVRLGELLERAGIPNLARRKPAALSHGEQQRVALCRALIHKPRILLADEPTANLDAENAEAVIELLLHAVHDDGAGLVCVTHDRSLITRFDQEWAVAGFQVRAGGEPKA